MILFNLMFIRHVFHRNYDSKIINESKFINRSVNKNLSEIRKNQPSSCKSLLLISKGKTNLNLNRSKNITDLANSKLISRNFITQLINNYWQETIFLSKSNILSDNYTNQLRSDGIAVYKNQYKKFLFEFSKALVTGRIEASLEDSKANNLINSNSTDIKYIWRKGLNFSLPKNFFIIISNKRQSDFPNKSQIQLMKQLKCNKLPIFTVTNNFNQIVVAEPSDELMSHKNIVDKIYQWYYDHFLWQKDKNPIYEGLFFVNPEDALEYQEYIKQKHGNNSQQNNLNIFASGLDFYYKLVRTSPPRVQFRLIPDLKELGELIYKYQYNNNISFHNQQKCGKFFFQGQPIYLIQPVLAKNKKTKEMELITYRYKLNEDHNSKKYEAIFMNYNTAIRAWEKFMQKNINYNLPNVPKILVYNLEDFLKMHEKDNKIYETNILFVPTQESYEFIKFNTMQKFQNNIISKMFLNKFLYFKIITQRIFWSLTSRQPVNW